MPQVVVGSQTYSWQGSLHLSPSSWQSRRHLITTNHVQNLKASFTDDAHTRESMSTSREATNLHLQWLIENPNFGAKGPQIKTSMSVTLTKHLMSTNMLTYTSQL